MTNECFFVKKFVDQIRVVLCRLKVMGNTRFLWPLVTYMEPLPETCNKGLNKGMVWVALKLLFQPVHIDGCGGLVIDGIYGLLLS